MDSELQCYTPHQGPINSVKLPYYTRWVLVSTAQIQMEGRDLWAPQAISACAFVSFSWFVSMMFQMIYDPVLPSPKIIITAGKTGPHAHGSWWESEYADHSK